MAKVFISYRQVEPDQSLARHIYKHLLAQAHQVFFDLDGVRLGDEWLPKIRDEVRNAEYFVALISLAYLNSKFIIEEELSLAAKLLREGKLQRLLHVNLAFDGEPPAAVREVVTQIQFLKWKGPNDTPKVTEALAQALPPTSLLVRGMRSFDVYDEKCFPQLGREHEIAALLEKLEKEKTRSVLVHGLSGAGKSSFVRAGVFPRLKCTASVVECNEGADLNLGSFDGAKVVFFDQFENILRRISRHPNKSQALDSSFSAWCMADGSPLPVFCIRDEYRTAFDTLLPGTAAQATRFPLLPFAPDVAAEVLSRLLETAQVKWDDEFIRALCTKIASGVPRTVLPAILQLIAQYCHNHQMALDATSWSRMTSADVSFFEEHIADTVLAALPRKISEVDATTSLLALTAGDVRADYKEVKTVAEENKLPYELVRQTFEIAAFPVARVVFPEVESEMTRYRLIHDLFAPAVRSLHRRAKIDSERRSRTRTIAILGSLLAALTAVMVFAWVLNLRLKDSENRALSRQLAAQGQLLVQGSPEFLDTGALLAIEAARRYPCVESDQALRSALALLPKKTASVMSPGFGYGSGLAFVTDTSVIAVGQSGAVNRWNSITGNLESSWDLKGNMGLYAFDEKLKRLAMVTAHKDSQIPIATNGNSVKVFDANGTLIGEQLLQKGIRVMALSPDGNVIASVDEGGLLQTYGLKEGKLLGSLQLTTKSIICNNLRFSPSGAYLTVACCEAESNSTNTGMILRSSDLAQLGSISHRDIIRDMVFSPGEQYVATVSRDESAKLAHIDGAAIVTITHPGGMIDPPTIAFSPDSRLVAIGTRDKNVWIHDAVTGSMIHQLLLDGPVEKIVFDHHGDHLATASEKSARIWDIANGTEISRMPHPDDVLAISFSADDQIFASASRGGKIRFDETPHTVQFPTTRVDEQLKGGFSPDEKYFVSVEDKTARLIDTKTNHVVSQAAISGKIDAVAIDSRNQTLALLAANALGVFQLDGKGGIIATREFPLTETGGSPRAIVLSDSGQTAALFFEQETLDTVEFRDVRTGEILNSIRGQSTGAVKQSRGGQWIGAIERVYEIDRSGNKPVHTRKPVTRFHLFSTDGGKDVGSFECADSAFDVALGEGGLVALPSTNGDVILRQVGNEKTTTVHFKGEQSPKIIALGLTPESSNLLVETEASGRRRLHVIQTADGAEIGGCDPLAQNPLLTAAVDPKSRQFACPGSTGVIEVHELGSNRISASLVYEDEISQLAYSPDGRYLAASTREHVAQIWDMTSHEMIFRMQLPEGTPAGWSWLSLAFNKNGKFLVTKTGGSRVPLELKVGVWLLDSRDLVSEIQSRLSRKSLTPAEWKHYLPGEALPADLRTPLPADKTGR